jgi:serine/threonine-protein kinase
VVHRDLKPSNVLVIRDSVGSDHIKVLDFGVAKFLAGGCDDRANTRMGTLLGTPLYMPPEQVRGQPGMDPRSDIYSLGCVMFEMVTGFVPFSGSACEIMSAHVERKPPRPSQFRHSICPELDALIVSMLAKNPDDRPASMELVSTRLRRISKLPRAWAMGGSSLPRADRSAARGTCGHRAVPTLVRPRRAGEACTSAPYAPHAPCPVWMRWAALGAVLCGALVLAACL